MRFERTVREIDGDYAVLVSDSGEESRTALALLPDGITEGTRLVFENFEYRILQLNGGENAHFEIERMEDLV